MTNLARRWRRERKQPRPLPRLSWPAYFLRFCEVHGDPVSYQGRLLFADGWSHSAVDYRGPEFPAPEEQKEAVALRLAYWLCRSRVVSEELQELSRQLQRLEDSQSMCSVALQQVVYYQNADGQPARRTEDLDLEYTIGRVAWLREDLEECQAQATQLRSELEGPE